MKKEMDKKKKTKNMEEVNKYSRYKQSQIAYLDKTPLSFEYSCIGS